jgi:hypothetical protein
VLSGLSFLPHPDAGIILLRSPQMHQIRAESPSPRTPAGRRPWVAPRVAELPRLTELTLQTGDAIPGGGNTGGGGSTVF